MVEFDHLISKAKLEEEENFKDFLNPVTRLESDGLADACLRVIPAGEVIQLERKGFFRVDRAYGGPECPAILFGIPDGRAKTLNPAAAAPAAKAQGKGKK
jgi:glutamyl-tRNA synthetase